MKKLGLLIAVLVLGASSAWGFGGPGAACKVATAMG